MSEVPTFGWKHEAERLRHALEVVEQQHYRERIEALTRAGDDLHDLLARLASVNSLPAARKLEAVRMAWLKAKVLR